MHGPQDRDPRTGSGPTGAALRHSPGEVAYRRAWWSLALYPITLVAAFAIGEGLFTVIVGDAESVSTWQVVASAVPALLVFMIPGMLAVVQGRKAMTVGRPDGKVPAIVGAGIALCVLGLNALSYVVALLRG